MTTTAAPTAGTVAVRAGLRGRALIDALVALLGDSKVLGTREDLSNYEYDGAVDTAVPDAVTALGQALFRPASCITRGQGAT